MRETVRLIGKGIRDGSLYLPTRNLAAALASTADPKDYYGQAEAIYNGFVNKWRYVRDPLSRELLTMSPRASYRLVMGGDGIGVGAGYGAGDCDCATVALGSLFESTGFPVHLAGVMRANAPPGQLLEHIYPEVYITGHGWIPADPVIFPRGKFGDEGNYSRKVVYDLNGSVLSYQGNLNGSREENMIPDIWNRAPMETFSGFPNYEQYIDYTDYQTGPVMIEGFGCLAEEFGCIPGGNLKGLSVEVDREDIVDGLTETPVLEVAPVDYEYMYYNGGRPYLGMLALSQDGGVYSFSGLSFKKIIKKTKAAFKELKSKVDKAIGKEQPKKKTESLTPDEVIAFLPPALKAVMQKAFKAQTRKRITPNTAKAMASLPAETRKKVDIAAQAEISKRATRKKKTTVQATRKPKHVRLPAKVVKPILTDLREGLKAIAPVAAVVPGAGPALKLGIEAAAAAPDKVLATNATKLLSAVSRVSPTAASDAKALIGEQKKLQIRLKEATRLYQAGKKQLTTARANLERLRDQIKRGQTPQAQIDVRAVDALKMARSLLRDQGKTQISAVDALRAAQNLIQKQTQSTKAAAAALKKQQAAQQKIADVMKQAQRTRSSVIRKIGS